MVYCRLDDKENDRQRNQEYETKAVDVDFRIMHVLWICGDQKYYGVSIWI